MTSKDAKVLKTQLLSGYSAWMSVIHKNWSGKLSKTELRVGVARILLNHLLDEVLNEDRRIQAGPRKMMRLISLLEREKSATQEV